MEHDRKEEQEVRTSATHPLRIAELLGGRVGITIAPGKETVSMSGGFLWARDFKTDFEAIRKWGGADVLCVSLLEQRFELPALRMSDMFVHADAFGLPIYSLPTIDRTVPSEPFTRAMCSRVRKHLFSHPGAKVLFFCNGGIGRSCVAAAILLIEMGIAPEQAIADVKAARPGTFDTEEQEDYVRSWRPR